MPSFLVRLALLSGVAGAMHLALDARQLQAAAAEAKSAQATLGQQGPVGEKSGPGGSPHRETLEPPERNDGEDMARDRVAQEDAPRSAGSAVAGAAGVPTSLSGKVAAKWGYGWDSQWTRWMRWFLKLHQPVLLLVGATLREPHAVHSIMQHSKATSLVELASEVASTASFDGSSLTPLGKLYRKFRKEPVAAQGSASEEHGLLPQSMIPLASALLQADPQSLEDFGWDTDFIRQIFSWDEATFDIVERVLMQVLRILAGLTDGLLGGGNATSLMQLSARDEVPPMWDWEAHGWGEESLNRSFHWNHSTYEAVTHGADLFMVQLLNRFGDLVDGLLKNEEATHSLRGLANVLHGFAQGDAPLLDAPLLEDAAQGDAPVLEDVAQSGAVLEDAAGEPDLLQLSARQGGRGQAGERGAGEKWDWALGWSEQNVNPIFHWNHTVYEQVTHGVSEWFGAFSGAVQEILEDENVLRTLHGLADIMDGLNEVASSLSGVNASQLNASLLNASLPNASPLNASQLVQLSTLAAKAKKHQEGLKGDVFTYIVEVVRPMLEVASQPNVVGEFFRVKAVQAVASPVLASLKEHGWPGKNLTQLMRWDDSSFDEMMEKLNTFLQGVLKEAAVVTRRLLGEDENETLAEG